MVPAGLFFESLALPLFLFALSALKTPTNSKHAVHAAHDCEHCRTQCRGALVSGGTALRVAEHLLIAVSVGNVRIVRIDLGELPVLHQLVVGETLPLWCMGSSVDSLHGQARARAGVSTAGPDRTVSNKAMVRRLPLVAQSRTGEALPAPTRTFLGHRSHLGRRHGSPHLLPSLLFVSLPRRTSTRPTQGQQ